MIDMHVVKRVSDMLHSAVLKNERTHSNIIEKATQILSLPMFSPCNDELLNAVVDRFISEISLNTFEPDTLTDGKYTNNWTIDKKDKTEYFDRYRRYLLNQGFNQNTIDNIRETCEKILTYCADPSNLTDFNHYKKKGLVIGDVQSGKTASYTGLINLACDYGYRIIVLLTGMTDSLRKQTQARIDAGFIGADSNSISSDSIKYIGVGECINKYFSIPLTNSENDFKKFIKENSNTQHTDFNKPIVLVVKKNASVLKQVLSWLKPGQNDIEYDNILIIDDEADNASLNNKKPGKDASTINKHIRGIYNNFQIASYVGYTATPFANIFIDPYDDENNKDLFPSNFIVQLHAPDNYFGIKTVFANAIENKYIRILDENEPNFLQVKHAKDDQYLGLAESLKEAILEFLVNNVIRTIRGDNNKHRSMMINISMYNDMQEQIKDATEEYINKLSNIINQDSYKEVDDFIKNPEMKKLYSLFMNEFYKNIRDEITFDEIKNGLSDEINKVIVAVINKKYKGDERFEYEKYSLGARVIMIGGFVLSRGLTLEGLMISYFSRNAAAYDTILQMCRWFGYRPKYMDLCRVYISQINIDNFNAVNDAVDDLKEQLKIMSIKGKTPSDFGLMIKESPDTLNTTLLITARNKMYNSNVVERYLNYGGIYADTSKIYKSNLENNTNINLIRRFIETLKEDGKFIESVKSRQLIKNVNQKHIAWLMSLIRVSSANTKFDTDSLSSYIAEDKNAKDWDVVFASGESNVTFNLGGASINLSERKFDFRDGENFLRISGTNNRIIDPGIFSSGLTDDQIEEVKRKSGKSKEFSAKDYLNISRKPLLAIYLLDLKVLDGEEDKKDIKIQFGGEPLVGFAIGFPNIEGSTRVKYRENRIKQQERETNLELEDDEDDEDDNDD